MQLIKAADVFEYVTHGQNQHKPHQATNTKGRVTNQCEILCMQRGARKQQSSRIQKLRECVKDGTELQLATQKNIINLKFKLEILDFVLHFFIIYSGYNC